jgi:hypothetical protein
MKVTLFKVTNVGGRNLDADLHTTKTELECETAGDANRLVGEAYLSDPSLLLAWVEWEDNKFIGTGPKWSSVSRNIKD